MSRASLADRIYNEVDEILTQISCATMKPVNNLKEYRLSLAYFDGAEILKGSPSITGVMEDMDWGVFQDVHPNDLEGKWDISILSGIDGYDDGGFSMSRFRSVPISKVRGIGRLRSSIIGEFSAAIVDTSSNTYDPWREYVQATGRDGEGNVAWDWIDSNPHKTRLSPKDLSEKLNVELGIQFTRNCLWRVCLGYEGRPSISFTTDPTGAREIFRLRDVPEGHMRRAALRNWVQEHWRKRRTCIADDVWVREHLRGAQTFKWHGMECKIIPSVDDLRRNQANKGK